MNTINIIMKRHAKNTTFAKMLTLTIACAISLNAICKEKMFRDGQLFYQLDDKYKTAEIIAPKYYDVKDDADYNQNKDKIIEVYGRIIGLQIPSQIECDGITYSIISIGREAFEKCSYLSVVNIPEGIVYIDDMAFGYCDRLTTVTLPSTIRQIGHGAFCHCYHLTNVICLAEKIPCLGNCVEDEFELHAVFYKDSYELQDTLYVPQKRVKKYKRANEWGRFKVVLPISE